MQLVILKLKVIKLYHVASISMGNINILFTQKLAGWRNTFELAEWSSGMIHA